MKSLLSCRSLIKVAVVMVVMVFMASWVTETYAKGKIVPYCDDAWDKKLGEFRFVLVMPTGANPDGEAVLDRETCLVWEQSPDAEGGPAFDGKRTWYDSLAHCFTKKVGGSKGWRVPTIEELSTLLDTAPFQISPMIPPALKVLTSNVQSIIYWSSTTLAQLTIEAYGVDLFEGSVSSRDKGSIEGVWCVRGGQGHDAY